MSYRIESLPTQQLFGPAMQATEALVRLDERIARSPVAKGFVERSHFADAASSLWLDGELAMSRTCGCSMRIWTGAPDKAYEILRLRLQILGNRPDWALGREGGLQYQSPRTANPPVHSKSKPH
ncbi:hypothetical protein CO731_05293 (plasmid) [Aminobacter sp. MSH1]|uniref:hypothetical protein n=1 Tax=Aminobacter sp. MSH1 TaxID=374606 RepID=UPI000D3DA4AE|nr:hypothetical protein [Aminobacter sp. MSH1]AWC25792.1 hypothetical protein CO731_05293 [Aminobacter sp. MSH1]